MYSGTTALHTSTATSDLLGLHYSGSTIHMWNNNILASATKMGVPVGAQRLGD